MAAILTKVDYKPARGVARIEPGLKYEYLESDISFISSLKPESNEARQLNSGIAP